MVPAPLLGWFGASPATRRLFRDTDCFIMSQRTWVCVPCERSYRRNQNIESLDCPNCGKQCEYVHWKIRIPSSRRRKEWNAFWAKYRAEKALLRRYERGELRDNVRLELLNMVLLVHAR